MGCSHQSSDTYIIFLGLDCFYRLAYGILLQVVHDARDFGNLGVLVVVPYCKLERARANDNDSIR
jgi:hypothetical protein